MDDAELVRAATGGNKDALGSIYQRYAAPLYDFLCAVLRDRDHAADVLQDTFMIAGSRMDQLRDPTKLKPWLYAIARHEALRSLKKHSEQQPWEEDADVVSQEPDPSHAASQAELAELVWAAAAGLNPRDRVVLDLHLRQGLEGQELGDALGVSPGHAYVLLSRLKEQVERSLGALLVTRLGRKDCQQLSSLLVGWDGRFTAQIRKRVVRHVENCSRCSDVRRRAVSPVSLLAAIPPIPLPEQVGTGIMENVGLVSHKGRPWLAGKGGFPPPLPGERKLRRAGWGAAAALSLGALLALTGAGSTIAQMVGVGQSQQPAAQSAGQHAGLTLGQDSPGTTSVSPPLELPPDNAALQDESSSGLSSNGAQGPEDPAGRKAGERTSPQPEKSPDTGDVASETPAPSVATRLAPDTTAPSIGRLAVTPSMIWAQESCSSPRWPKVVSVEVAAKDAGGIRSVVLNWGGPAPGSTSMRHREDGIYAATVGPFSDSLIAPGASVTVPLVAMATDRTGNASSARGSFILRCDTRR